MEMWKTYIMSSKSMPLNLVCANCVFIHTVLNHFEYSQHKYQGHVKNMDYEKTIILQSCMLW